MRRYNYELYELIWHLISMIYLSSEMSCLQFISEYDTVGVTISVSLEDVSPDEQIILYYSALDLTLNLMTPAM